MKTSFTPILIKWLHLRVLVISAGLIFIGTYASAQAIGDYRSNVTSISPWDNVLTWQTWDGGAWVAATDYPGQNPGTGLVTITDGDAIILNVSPANTIGSLIIQEGITDNSLTISDGFTLSVTGNAQISAATSGIGIIKQIVINGATAQLNCASLTLLPGPDDFTVARLLFNNGGIASVTGSISMGILTPLRTYITFGSGGTLNVGGNIVGGDIIPGSGIINFNGTGVQNIGSVLPLTFYNVGMTNAASILQLNGNVTLNNMLTLTAGKINTQANILTLDNANLVTGGNSSSYVYSTGTGRFRRNGLTATAYNFPVGTSTNYLPVIVSPAAGTSDFSVNVFSPATTNGTEGGPVFTDKSGIVDAVWNIDRPVGTGDATITIQWDAALEGATFATYTDGQIGVSRNVAGSWTATVANFADATANIVNATFNAFSPFGIGKLGVVLPLKFGSINAYKKQNGIQLDWKVYSENKVKDYEVERSADARSFTTVGSLPAVHNNSTDGDYRFFDANPLSGTNYYRIKKNDLNGKSSYSPVIRINNTPVSSFSASITPNPAGSVMNLTIEGVKEKENLVFEIVNINGMTVHRENIAASGTVMFKTLDRPSLQRAGLYFYKITRSSNNETFTGKLVLQ